MGSEKMNEYSGKEFRISVLTCGKCVFGAGNGSEPTSWKRSQWHIPCLLIILWLPRLPCGCSTGLVAPQVCSGRASRTSSDGVGHFAAWEVDWQHRSFRMEMDKCQPRKVVMAAQVSCERSFIPKSWKEIISIHTNHISPVNAALTC